MGRICIDITDKQKCPKTTATNACTTSITVFIHPNVNDVRKGAFERNHGSRIFRLEINSPRRTHSHISRRRISRLSEATTFSEANFSLNYFFVLFFFFRADIHWHSKVLGARRGRIETSLLRIDLDRNLFGNRASVVYT